MGSKSGIDVLTQDWVQTFHFENKMDLNLQAPAENESTKIEVGDIPIDLLPKLEFSSLSSSTSVTTSSKNDSYLQSILSSASPAANTSHAACTGSNTCVCYKCQRQRRRAGLTRDVNTNKTQIVNNKQCRAATEDKTAISFTPSVQKNSSPPTMKMVSSPPPIRNGPTAPVSYGSTSPQTNTSLKRGNTLRKTPTLKSYEKHMPKPTYSQRDSIYHIEQQQEEDRIEQESKKTITLNVAQHDNYRMAWKEDGTGDDLLSSLVTFQTIFEEKGNGDEGLSDLLEKRTQELKRQKLREQQEALKPEKDKEGLPPRQPDCLTLSYRNGPKHNPLTLYHTMKMHGEQERMGAYSTAFRHCINANSGLKDWIKKSRIAPTREGSKLIQTVRKSTVKRSLLHPLSSRKNKATSEESLIWSTSTESLSINTGDKKSIEMISSPLPFVQPTTNDGQLTDVLSAAQALLPNQNLGQQQLHQKGNKIPYEHIDTPGRPRNTPPVCHSPVDVKDNCSISSSESLSGSSKLLMSRPGRLLSSLGRKPSMRSHNNNKPASVKSLEKIDSGNESQTHEKVLNDLCHILPHIDRAQLSPYVYEANNDYMTALQLCKSAVISGKLS